MTRRYVVNHATQWLLLAGLALAVVFIAGATAAHARQEGYPPPALETPTLAVPASTPSAYPPQLLPAPIGGQPGVPTVDPAAVTPGVVGGTTFPAAQPVEGPGLLYLWLGFIATLLIFVTCVVGAATLFTRRNEA